MASTPFAFQADSGQTLTVKFEADDGTGTPAASYSATEKTTAKGWYTITITEALVDGFFWHAEDGSANIVANGLAKLVDDTVVYFGFDPASSTGYAAAGSGPTAAVIADAVWDEATSGHSTAGTTGKALIDVLAVTDATIADAVWDELYAGHVTASTFGEFVQALSTQTSVDSLSEQLSNISLGSSAITTVATSFTKTVGGTETNSVTDTEALDGTTHNIEDLTNNTDIYYEFDLGPNGVPTEVTWNGYAASNGDTYRVYFYNWVDAAWDQVGTISGSNNTNIGESGYIATVQHVGSGADDGTVRFRFESTDGTEIHTDRILCKYTVIPASTGYEGGAVWVDETAGTSTGTTPGVDALVTNRSDDFDNAQTIADALGYNHIMITAGTSVTLSAALDGYIIGDYESNYSLDLGSQSITGTNIVGCSLSGVASGSNVRIQRSVVNTATIPPGAIAECAINGPLTLLTGDYIVYSCVAGTSSPTITLGAGASTIAIRNWSGPITLSGLTGSSTVFLDGVFETITLNGASATVNICGSYKNLVNNLTGTPDVNVDGAIQAGLAGYEGGAVWVDEVAGTSSGTVSGVDAIVTSRADDFDNAHAIAASLNFNNIRVQNDNTITLSATINNFIVGSFDSAWNLALGGQDITDTTFLGAQVSGIGTGTYATFGRCLMTACTVPPGVISEGVVAATVTLGSAGSLFVIDCNNGGAATFDMGAAIGTSSLVVRKWAGDITISNIAAGDTVSIGGTLGIVTLNGADGTVEIEGSYGSLVNNLTGSPTLVTDGAYIGNDVGLGKDQATIAAQNVQK